MGYCVEDILPLRAITRFDTVAGLFNIGKLKPLAVLTKDTILYLVFLVKKEMSSKVYIRDVLISFLCVTTNINIG